MDVTMRNRQPDTGDSAASIYRRSDDESWQKIEAALREPGVTLRYVPKLGRAYIDRGAGPCEHGITRTRVRKLEQQGVLRFVGVDRYTLATP